MVVRSNTVGNRVPVWLAWSSVALSVGLAAAYFLVGSQTAELAGSTLADALFLLLWLVFPVVGAVIASHRPDNLIGWIFCLAPLLIYLGLLGGGYARYATLTQPFSLPAAAWMAWLGSWSFLVGLGLLGNLTFLFFPNGRLLSGRWRWVVRLSVLTISLAALSNALLPSWPPYPSLANPVGLPRAAGVLQAIKAIAEVVMYLLLLVSVASLFLRFRRGAEQERQQLKWVAYAAGMIPVVAIVSLFFEGEVDAIADLAAVGPIGVPIAVGVAILKYRLYDIDLIIRRTLVYGALTSALALVYFGSVVTIQQLFRTLTGQETELAIVVSTLAIAALFNPLRHRIQGFIDQRFYRRKYDAQKTLAAFSASLRDGANAELEHLVGELVRVIDGTVQPVHVSLWLRDVERGRVEDTAQQIQVGGA